MKGKKRNIKSKKRYWSKYKIIILKLEDFYFKVNNIIKVIK